MKLKTDRWLFITVVTCFLGCGILNYEEPLSKSFDFLNARYWLVAQRDSLVLQFYDGSSDVVLNYRIRNVNGRCDHCGDWKYFRMPFTDSLSMTWYNGSRESLMVTFPLNHAVFDSMPASNDSVAKIIHPGDVIGDYSISIVWASYNAQINGWTGCLDSSGRYHNSINDSIRYMEQKIFIPPEIGCKIGNVEIGREDSVNHGIVQRYYRTVYHIN